MTKTSQTVAFPHALPEPTGTYMTGSLGLLRRLAITGKNVNDGKTVAKLNDFLQFSKPLNKETTGA